MNRGKLFFVDDVEYDRILICKYLSKSGFDFTVFNNGPDLISALADAPGGTVLIDIEMPGMNGLEIARSIRSTLENPSKRFTLIGLTGHCERTALDEIAASGFDDCLNKPILKNDLINKLLQYVKPDKQDNENQRPGQPVLKTLYSLDCLDIDDEEFMKSIIHMFIENTPESVRQLKNAHLSKDWPLLRNIAHKLKPHFLYFGIREVVEALQETEDIAAHQQNIHALPELLLKIEEISDAALDQLKSKYEPVASGSYSNTSNN